MLASPFVADKFPLMCTSHWQDLYPVKRHYITKAQTRWKGLGCHFRLGQWPQYWSVIPNWKEDFKGTNSNGHSERIYGTILAPITLFTSLIMHSKKTVFWALYILITLKISIWRVGFRAYKWNTAPVCSYYCCTKPCLLELPINRKFIFYPYMYSFMICAPPT